MSEAAKAAQEAAKLVDLLEEGLDDNETVGEVMLLCEIRVDDGKSSYLWYRCSSESTITQMGMLSWAHSAATRGNDRIPNTDDDEDEDDG